MGVIQNSDCVFCGQMEEDREHLFFDCIFSKKIWHEVLRRNNQSYRCMCWQQELEMAMDKYKGKSVGARIGRLAMAVTIYSIWQERNSRTFEFS